MRSEGQGFVLLGAINGFLGVALGAFGAHLLRERLSPAMLDVYKTGVQYHLVHAVALLFIGVLVGRGKGNRLNSATGWLFTAGILLFSGSLYALAVSGNRLLGAITPFGGVCFLAGWVLLALSAIRAVE